MDEQGGGSVVRMPKDNNHQLIDQLQTISRKLTEFETKFKAFCPSPMVEARIIAAMNVMDASITCIMKRVRGKKDVRTRMAADFGAGATCRLITQMGDPYVAGDASIVGVVCALIGGSIFQLGQKISQPPVEYTRTRHMLSNLGLQNYEKNFKKGLLTDNAIPLLTESALKDMGVPPGPRLLILDHIERDPDLQKMRQGRAG